MGLGFGLLLLSPALAIALSFLLSTLLTVVTGLVSWSADVAPWVDPDQATLPLTEVGAVTGREWVRVATASALWCLVPLVLGALRVSRREVG